jgi:hypothetical protein
LELCQSLVAPSLPPFSLSTSHEKSTTNKNQKKNKTPHSPPKDKKQEKQEKQQKSALHAPIFYVYTLTQLKKSSIANINTYVLRFVEQVLKRYQTEHAATDVLYHAYECIEKNPYLIRYEDRTLFPHQKRLFQISKTNPETPKLILYIAPTGTGKTLSPIALAEGFRVIFVCVARHVGFALAQTAISVGRKIATAFGCDTADSIRLHNNAAKEFIRNKRSGGIGKIDHSIGDNVELMICDVQSYIPAMHYMMSFHDPSTLITFWDEPTITLDKEIPPNFTETDSENVSEEEKGEGKTIAQMIHRIWAENRIPRMILSCATLPKEEEILPVLSDFRERFDNAEIHTVSSVDCRKSIGLLNSHGYPVLPHCLFEDYRDLMECVQFCEEDLTTLRYFDLREMIRFLRLLREITAELSSDMGEIEQEGLMELNDVLKIHIPLEKITLQEVKQHYLNVLKTISADYWPKCFQRAKESQIQRFSRHSSSSS